MKIIAHSILAAQKSTFQKNLIYLALLSYSLFSTTISKAQTTPDFLINYNTKWIDSVFLSMTLEEKIGQLLMPRANLSGKPYNEQQLQEWIKKYKIGGLVFFASTPHSQTNIINNLQNISKIPLLIGQDLEWGLAMRLDSADRFPYALTMGAIVNGDSLIYAVGQEIGKQCKAIGVHVNFAPVVDINLNPKNPVINFRSFGDDKKIVARYGNAMVHGLQSQNIISVAKHFPGHGDTDVDSHYELPVISHSKSRLDSVELFPFIHLINNGLAGIMTAHLNIPSLEPEKGLASTFSKNIIQKSLKDDLQFKGLVFTDAMDMKAAIKNYPEGESIVRALLAGNDIVETFEDVPNAIFAIQSAIKDGRISKELIDLKVKKILKAKSWVGLDKYRPIKVTELSKNINSINADVLNYKLAQKSVTCLKNYKQLLPITSFNKKINLVTLGNGDASELFDMLKNFAEVNRIIVPQDADSIVVDSLLATIHENNLLIVGFVTNDIRPAKNYGLDTMLIKQINTFANHPNAILAILANPYCIPKITNFNSYNSVLLGYQNTPYTQRAIGQALFGAEAIAGRLPVIIHPYLQSGQGISIDKEYILSYAPSEIVHINRNDIFEKIDSVILEGLEANAFPGCVVQASKDGIVFFQDSYGHTNYNSDSSFYYSIQNSLINDVMDNELNYPPKDLETNAHKRINKLNNFQVYDLASLTKITGTMLILLKLASEKKFDFDKPLSIYYPRAKGSNKESLTFRDMLTHRAGLQSWIPFWKDAIDTISTIQKAIAIHPELDTFIEWHIKKPNFLQKLFGKDTEYSVLNLHSLQENINIWSRLFNSKTITWKENVFSPVASKNYNIYITEKLWLNKEYYTTIEKRILQSPLLKKIYGHNQDSIFPYVYSDLHFYFYPSIIKKIINKDMKDELKDIYGKIGAYSFSYTPNLKDDIAPTEYDSLFRKSIIRGTVHDEGAAMIGGVSGHAGLFANANDVNKVMQMYLQSGRYGRHTFIEPKYIKEATTYQFLKDNNRRGIGFDKKDPNISNTNTSSLVSENSFGHSGFTGTYTWVDPDRNLVYVFLSNRTFPNRSNTNINTLNIRTKILDILLEAIDKDSLK